MVKVGDRIRLLRKRANLTQAALAKLAGVSTGTIRNAEDSAEKQGTTITWGAVAGALAKKLKMNQAEVEEFLIGELPKPAAQVPPELVAQVREIEKRPPSPEWLGTAPPPPNTRVRPLPGGDDIAGGGPINDAPDIDPGDPHQFLPGELFPWDDSAFWVRVKGHSMHPDFRDGDVVIGSPAMDEQAESGDVVCIRFTMASRFRGGRTIKRIRKLDNRTYRLESINPAVPNIGEVLVEEVDAIGPAVMLVRPLWKERGFSVGDIAKARRVAASEPSHPVGEIPQKHPDYEGDSQVRSDE